MVFLSKKTKKIQKKYKKFSKNFQNFLNRILDFKNTHIFDRNLLNRFVKNHSLSSFSCDFLQTYLLCFFPRKKTL